MLHIDSITLHNFKSFGHAAIRFGNGFNCIVGPNGSGKSNICDALLFALGETSLRRMRVSNSVSLISEFQTAKRRDSARRSSVTLVLAEDGARVEVTRAISQESGIGYRIGGKPATLREVEELLTSMRCNIDETNTITQGEINRFLNLTPRERRELIDAAAGVREFDEKKAAALKELERAESRIAEATVIINERRGFIAGLEKERNEALRYIELSEQIKQLAFSLLKRREAQLLHEYESASESAAGAASAAEAARANIKSLDDQIGTLNVRRKEASDRLNMHSIEIGGASKQLEQLNNATALGESRLAYLKENADRCGARRAEIRNELARISAQASECGRRHGELSKQLADKDSVIKGYESVARGYEEQIRSYDAYASGIEDLSKAAADASAAVAAERAALLDISATIGALAAERDVMGAEAKEHAEKLAACRLALDETVRAKEELAKAARQAAKEQEQLNKALEDGTAEALSVREALASAGSSDTVARMLREAVKQGFYGRAYELCSYDDKYAIALNAAGAARLSYFVVESTAVAAQAIEVLKARGVGRASFIPLGEVSPERREPVPHGSDPLIGHVRFEKRFEKAFSYIFSNTYLIGSLDEAKRGRHRLVTLGGEVVEPTGIVTGGSTKQLRSQASLAARLAAIERQNAATLELLHAAGSAASRARELLAAKEAEALALSSDVRHAEAELARAENGLEALRSKLESASKAHAARTGRLQELEAAESRTAQALEAHKAAAPRGQGAESGGMAELEALRHQANDLRSMCSSLLKEREMLSNRIAELKHEDEGVAEEQKRMEAERSAVASALEKQRKEKGLLEEQAKSYDKVSGSLFALIKEIDTELSSVAQRRGAAAQELERAERALMELSVRKRELETRLGDIRAELTMQASTEELPFDIAELEKRLSIATGERTALGNVNMKAPEAYEARAAEMREAEERLETLKKERSSVLAMIDHIEARKAAAFMHVFNDVNKHFGNLYAHIFNGSAALVLDTGQPLFDSGLGFDIEIGGRRVRTIEQLSGGQTSLLMLILIFSIQRTAPKAFYIFDEIDSSLDKENTALLSKLLKELGRESQLIVVSHNDALITAANTALGVARNGAESTIVGIELQRTA